MINSIVETKCLVKIQNLIDDAECFHIIRELRWPGKIMTCVFCDSENIIKHGQHNTQPERRRYFCKACGCYFDDLTGTVFEKRHRPLRVWILCLYFMGLNLSESQIAEELDLNESDVQNTATELREEITVKKPKVVLAGEVESDEVYIVAGHKGNPDAVEKKRERGKAEPPERCGRTRNSSERKAAGSRAD